MSDHRPGTAGGDALALVDISKRFGGGAAATLALDHADFRVRAGTIHALLGENGAGKTTLMRIAFGLLPPDSGSVSVGGTSVTVDSPAAAIALGVGMVHQHYTNVPAMSVVENIALGQHGRFRARDSAEQVRALSQRVGLPVDLDAIVGDLSVAAQQRVEILKAISRNAKLLILDEPTAVLAPAESEELLRWLRGFADAGGTVVLITHKLGEALTWADDITVLRAGRTVFTGARRGATIESIAGFMLGSAPEQERKSRPVPHERGRVVARARDISLHDQRGLPSITRASFELHAGEIVGVAGVDGAGQSDLLRALARRSSVSAGALELPDSIAFIPEDRQRDACILDFTLSENVALKGAGSRHGVMAWGDISRDTASMLREFDVRGGEPDSHASALSGGNQQKLVLARELAGAPELVVAENPTRGLDIRAAAAVADRLRAARDAGAAVVVYSSDLDDVIDLASRVLVVHSGRVTETPPDRAIAGAAMLGLS